MSSETKTCQNCKNEFVIEPEDFEFYQKINVPPPTWCPRCRMIRRMIWRNERALYARKCNLCKERIISVYHPNSPYAVYCPKCWWSDKLDPEDYALEYDFNRPFFEQFRDLIKVPLISLIAVNSEKVDYANPVNASKNVYLSFSVAKSENIFYSALVDESKDIFDSVNVKESELLYNCLNSTKCFNSIFLENCKECVNSLFLFNCVNCTDCFLCVNLRNKKYCIFNQQYTKEDYFKKFEEIKNNLTLKDLINNFNNFKLKYIRKYSNLNNVNNVTGDEILNSKNCFNVFYAYDSENVKHSYRAITLKDSYDITGGSGELIYESLVTGYGGYMSKFFAHISSNDNRYCEYCIGCGSSSNLFGCIGFRNKQYCILNKQYSKEEYEKLIPKIIEHMNTMPYVDKQGRVYKYGEFFPPELSPFAYNETIAQEYFPLTKEEALSQGFKWKDPEEKDIKPDLPDHIKDVKEDIIGKTIQCAHAKIKENGTLEQNCNEQCTTAFKVIPEEFEFYKKMNLPLPRLCPNCRHYQRLKQRNPLKLWHRKCDCVGQKSKNGIYQNTQTHFHENQPCPNEFETSYSPNRPEIVYCDACYNREVE